MRDEARFGKKMRFLPLKQQGLSKIRLFQAGVAELADALDLGSSDESRGGSSPSARTKLLA
jgi:hypothetical protein